MIKRIFIGIVSFVLGAVMLTGCSAFQYDYDRDFKQVVAEMNPYTVTVNYDDDNGDTKVYKYEAKLVKIYKMDLVEYVNNNQSSLSQNAATKQEMYDNALKMLINTEIIANEAEAYINAGEIAWDAEVNVGTDDEPIMRKTYTQTNAVKRRVYQVIDSTLLSIKNEILERRDEPTISTSGDGDMNTDTTYPVKPEETEDVDDFEIWAPDEGHYPGLIGDSEARSLDAEALRRFITLLRERVEDDFRVTAEDKEKFAADDERINEIINTQGVPYVYPILGDTHYVYYISGKQLERSQKFTELQSYLTDSVEVTDADVQKSFTETLNSQKASYDADIAAYNTAMSGSTTVLYHPEVNHFYVKHILLPFSDKPKADLEAYKKRLNVTKDQVEAYRAALVDGIVCYPHLYGEDDKSRPMTVSDVMNAIKSEMRPLETTGNVKAADTAFDDLIYLYNTDTGAFGNNKGYVVKYKLDSGESETYMQEFADAARKMRDTLDVGQVLYENVVTDYGVHIMYLASIPKAGKVDINDYTTPGELQTYYDLIKKPLQSSLETEVYQRWEAQAIKANYDAHATVYEKRYKNLWED